MSWKVERSDDQVSWREMVSFHSPALAHRAFDMELVLKKAKYIRLVSPNGEVEERASTEYLPD